MLTYSIKLNDSSRSLGGSSAGSAVSVSAGFAFAAFATDIDGDISHAASRQALYSLKVARLRDFAKAEGCWRLSERLDTLGAMTRSPRELVTAVELIRKRILRAEDGAFLTDIKPGAITFQGFHIGYVDASLWRPLGDMGVTPDAELERVSSLKRQQPNGDLLTRSERCVRHCL